MSDINPYISKWLENEIARHKFWRNLWSFCYFLGTSTTIVCGALTTASAGFIESNPHGAAITAALGFFTTVSASLEKVLRLREKWDLHRNVYTSLEMIYLCVSAQTIDLKEALIQIDKVAQAYNNQLGQINVPSN